VREHCINSSESGISRSIGDVINTADPEYGLAHCANERFDCTNRRERRINGIEIAPTAANVASAGAEIALTSGDATSSIAYMAPTICLGAQSPVNEATT
jgi:membrane-bound ClpP family serine protease